MSWDATSPHVSGGGGGRATTRKVEQLIKNCPQDTVPMVLGDLNADLEYP